MILHLAGMPTTITNHQFTARRLVLVDQENLCGGPPKKLPEAGVRLLAAATQGVVGRRRGDHVIVAANPAWRKPITDSWSDADHRFRGGPDGADIELCEQATTEMLQRFVELWIVSGDRRLAQPALAARRMGLHVTVVSRPDSLAHDLRLAATRVLPFKWLTHRQISSAA